MAARSDASAGTLKAGQGASGTPGAPGRAGAAEAASALVLRIDPKNPEPELIARAAGLLRQGQVAVLPTDTVYGLGLLVGETATLQQLFLIKQRDADKSIPLLVASLSCLQNFAVELPPYAWQLAEQYWPGPLTLVVQASAALPRAFLAEDGTVALRVPDCAVTLALLAALEAPLATTSANLQGQPPATAISQLDPAVASQVGLVIDAGATRVKTASTIVSCLAPEPTILRSGALSASQIK